MVKKIYKLKANPGKYKTSASGSPKSFYDLQMNLNKRRVKKALKIQKRFKRPNPWLQILQLLAFYYALVGFIILLSHLGR